MREPVTAYVGLGANLGDAAGTLKEAMRQLGLVAGVSLARQSSLYRSAPVDSSGPDYINAVVQLQTVLTAPELLACLHWIEQAAGRERPYRNAPRTLDLDILLYGDGQVNSAALTIPHPRMWQRAFVLVPLAEIAPQRVTPAQSSHILIQGVAKLP
jgi:2-amino-4-hydroxy-6-hydroxymethyldihydropteridine diphosphokinase